MFAKRNTSGLSTLLLVLHVKFVNTTYFTENHSGPTHCKILAYHSNRFSIYHHHRHIVNREILLSAYLKSRYSKFTVDPARCSTVSSAWSHTPCGLSERKVSLFGPNPTSHRFFLSQLWRSITSRGQKRRRSITSRFQKRLRSSRKISSISARF